MDSNQQKFKWALLVVDRMKQLRAEGFRFVDQEVIPNFDGTPKGMFAWFICEQYDAREEFDLQDHFCDPEQDIGTPSKTTSTGTWRSFRKLPVSRDSSGRPDFSTIQSRRKWLLDVSRLLRMREPDRRG